MLCAQRAYLQAVRKARTPVVIGLMVKSLGCKRSWRVQWLHLLEMPRLTSICSWLHSMWNVQFLSNHDAPHRLNLYPGGKIWSGAGLQLGSWPGICMQFTVVFSILPPTCVPAQLHLCTSCADSRAEIFVSSAMGVDRDPR